jgi:hypothetical protein
MGHPNLLWQFSRKTRKAATAVTIEPFTQAPQLLKIAAVGFPGAGNGPSSRRLVSIQDFFMLSLRTVAGCIATAGLFVIGGIVLLSACSQELPPRSAIELMADPAVREAVLLRCSQLQQAALRNEECRNVREAVERLAAEEQESQPDLAQQEADESFERAREARRARDERERQRRQAEEKPVDPYTMPLVPEQPTASIPAAAVMSAAALPES